MKGMKPSRRREDQDFPLKPALRHDTAALSFFIGRMAAGIRGGLTCTHLHSRYRHTPESPIRVVTGGPLTPALSRVGERGKETAPYMRLVAYKVGYS